MADTAAHLIDRVLPRAPVRQWVLSLPVPLRYRLAYDAKLTSEVLSLFVRAVFGSLRRRSASPGQTGKLRCGTVTFIQRFGDALNLNVHFHMLAIDGTFDAGDDMRFRPVPPPDDDEVALVARRVARNLARLIERRGLGHEADRGEADPLSIDQPMLAALYAASVRGRVATGPRSGQRVLRLGDRVDPDHISETTTSPLCVDAGGVSIHANVAVPPNDRARLERLCRYVARPPLASERLERGPDGRLLYRLRHRWRDGTTHMLFEPVELLERLAALVPPPRFNMVRYHGVLGPAAKRRAVIVPRASSESSRADTIPSSCAGVGCARCILGRCAGFRSAAISRAIWVGGLADPRGSAWPWPTGVRRRGAPTPLRMGRIDASGLFRRRVRMSPLCGSDARSGHDPPVVCHASDPGVPRLALATAARGAVAGSGLDHRRVRLRRVNNIRPPAWHRSVCRSNSDRPTARCARTATARLVSHRIGAPIPYSRPS